MKYSKYENFSTNSAASETNKAMEKLDEAGKTDDGRKEEFKIIGGMDINNDNRYNDINRYGPEPRYMISDFENMINEYDNRINISTTSQELMRIKDELDRHKGLFQTSLNESSVTINILPSNLRNTVYNTILDMNTKINKLNKLINKANLKIKELDRSGRGTKRPYSSIAGKRKKKSKSKKKRKSKRKTKKVISDYTYTLYMLPNKEIVEIIEYDDKYKKNIKNNYNNMHDMKDYYNTLKKIDNIPCNKNELHPNKLIKK